jgi:uncharacterized protein YkwD
VIYLVLDMAGAYAPVMAASTEDNAGRRPLKGRWVLGVVGLLTLAMSVAPTPFGGGPPASAQSTPEWLSALNAYRGSSGLAPVEVDANLLVGVRNHVGYMASAGTLTHAEQSDRAGYTPQGDAAAKRGVLAAAIGAAKTERQMIEDWLSGPFHSLPLLDPRVRTAAFASATSPQAGPFASLGMMDIGTLIPTPLKAPVLFPGPGSTVSRTTRTLEAPNSLSHCPGFVEPAGMPMIAQFPTPPSGATGTLTANGSLIEVCIVDSSYRNQDASDQQIGRLLLSSQNAVFMIPKQPLARETKYEAKIDAGPAGSTSWTFTVGSAEAQLPGPLTSLPTVSQPLVSPSTPTTRGALPAASSAVKKPVQAKTTKAPLKRSTKRPVKKSTTKKKTATK